MRRPIITRVQPVCRLIPRLRFRLTVSPERCRACDLSISVRSRAISSNWPPAKLPAGQN